jgi:hypothetical protein
MGAPDYHDIVKIEQRMKSACKKMHDMASELAMAVTVIERDSDNRKNCLARHQLKHIKAGESAVASEVLARADPQYDREYQRYAENFTIAQQVKIEYENEKTSWDTARSLLARQREQIKTLPETEA